MSLQHNAGHDLLLCNMADFSSAIPIGSKIRVIFHATDQLIMTLRVCVYMCKLNGSVLKKT